MPRFRTAEDKTAPPRPPAGPGASSGYRGRRLLFLLALLFLCALFPLLFTLCPPGGGRAAALALTAAALLLVLACALCSRRRERQLREAARLQDWLLYRDLDGFFTEKGLPAGAPPLVGQVLRRLMQVFGDQYSARILEKQMEYSALQSQINPHFLYNTLEAIRSEALLCGQPDIAVMTEKLSRFFRYCISNRGDTVTLREELDNVRDYFFIQQFRFENRFTLTVHNKDEELLDFVLPKLTLQPLVENAIFHGLEQKPGPGQLNIYLVGTPDRLYLTLSDDGVGMEEATVQALNGKLSNPLGSADLTQPESRGHGSGIALSNVNGRLKLFFGDRADIHISSTPGRGTDVQLVLPTRHSPRQRTLYGGEG